jgi:catechol 2,3-dioxygenase-like lactoylglutathione lyase family enzyme
MIGRLYEVVIDCPDPKALAAFYAALTGLEVKYEDGNWVTLGQGDGTRVAFQRVAEYRPPTWPDPAHPQHMHLDVFVKDLDEADRRVLALGARQLQDGEGSRVYADPAGHPFCLSVENASAP